MWDGVPVVITSFGFHSIIPTLTTYLHRDRKQLRLTLFVGSLIPFFVYVIWEFLILGIVPIEGDGGLLSAWAKGETAAASLSLLLANPWLGRIASAFSLFAIITSFLGVSLSLTDFLTDGFKMKRFSWGREFASLLTFLPPLLFVYTYPGGFILALQYAGIFVAILLCILPALMAWTLPRYRTRLRRCLLLSVLLLSSGVIVFDILEERGVLRELIQPYLSRG